MKIKTKDLQAAVKKAIRFTSKRTTVPISMHFLLKSCDDGLTISAYNFERSCRCFVEGAGNDKIFLTVPAKVFHDDILGSNSEYVNLSVSKKNKLVVKTDRHRASISTMDGNMFFSINMDVETTPIDVSFLVGLEMSSISVSNKTQPQVLCGIHIVTDGKNMSIFGTDRIRATKYAMDFATDSPFDVVVPVEFAKSIAKAEANAEGIGVSCDGTSFYVRSGTDLYMSQLLSGSYPDVNQMFMLDKSGYVDVEMSGGDLSEALKRTMVFAKSNDDTIYLIYEDGNISFRTISAVHGESEVVIDAKAEKNVRVSMNAKYLWDFASLVRNVDTSIKIRKETEPVYMNMGDRFTYLLMPVRYK